MPITPAAFARLARGAVDVKPSPTRPIGGVRLAELWVVTSSRVDRGQCLTPLEEARILEHVFDARHVSAVRRPGRTSRLARVVRCRVAASGYGPTVVEFVSRAGDEGIAARVEIVLAIVSPIGSDAATVCSVLADELLERVGYSSETIRISELIETGLTDPDSSGGNRHRRLMDQGDHLREQAQDGGFCAMLAVQAVRLVRAAVTGDEEKQRHAGATIIRSLKHPDEVRLLRRVYGERLVVIGVSEDQAVRQERLRQLLLKEISRGKKTAEDEAVAAGEAASLILRDEKDERSQLGQRVRDAYELCDVYLPTSQKDLEADARRLVELLFGRPFVTPTRDEMGVWHAYASKFRSSAAGRQVGAVIVDEHGEVLVTGCNDVPAPLGGQNWHGDDKDYRDFALGSDANDSKKFELTSEMLGELARAGWLKDELSALGSAALAERALSGRSAPLNKTRVDELLEFGRIMHAEMAAIMTAARRGTPIRSATLYTTTYPCHECMRLILGAGIARVVYVDAYPKSLVPDLYGTHLRGPEGSPDKVSLERFVGVAPRLVEQVFGQVASRTRNVRGTYSKWVGRESQFVGSEGQYADTVVFQELAVGQLLHEYLDGGVAKATESN
jgi:deoxycytidylate deaminase